MGVGREMKLELRPEEGRSMVCNPGQAAGGLRMGVGAAERPQGAPSARAKRAYASPRSVDLAMKTVESLLKTGATLS